MSDNIKVAIRVRPLIEREEREQLPIQWVVKNNGITQIDPETKKLSETQFHFDYVFDIKNNNDDIFNATAKPIVEAVMKGINGTIFTYGQTGSGKTYTMLGSKTEKGVIGLTVDHIFNYIKNDMSRNYLLRISYIEIYMEKINDLLDKNRTDLKVKEDCYGHIIVDCKEEVASSPDSIFHAMKRGEKLKRTGETNMNERSSRSHTIFRIIVESCDKNDSENAQMEAQLNLIDLAGSERANLTGATGERFNEGRHINLSLSTLSLVIKQLSESNSSKFVNYRDSKLTRILQPSLGGNALTTIICTVTPAALEETQCTLDFAVRAKGVKNKPQINEEISDKALLKKVLRQVHKLQNELNSKNSQIEEAKKRENNREEILVARINNLWASIASTTCRSETRRRRTWAGGHSNKISLDKSHNFMLPTIMETGEKLQYNSRDEKSVIGLNLNDDSFKTELPDFELQLLKDQQEKCRLSTISDDGFLPNGLTVRDNRLVDISPDDDIFNLPVTPEKRLQVPQENCVCKRSPGTPKVILRKKIEELQSEFTTLREFTILEKQAFQDNLLKTDPSKKLDDIEYMKKSLEDSELICLDLNKKYSKLQSEHAILLSNHEELQNKYEQLYKENQSLNEIHDRFTSVEVEKNEYKNKMNEVLKKLKNLEDEAASYECEMELLKKKHKNREKELEISLNLAWDEFIKPEEKKKLTDIVHLQSVVDELQKKLSFSQILPVTCEKKISEFEEIIVNKVTENEVEVNRNLELTQKLEETMNKLKLSEDLVNELKESIEKLESELEVKVSENLELKKRTEEEVDSVIDKVSTTIDSEEFLPALSEGALSRNNSHNDLLDSDSKSITGQNHPELLKNLVEEQKSEIVRLEKLLEEKTNYFSSEIKLFEEKINYIQMFSDKLKDQLAAMQSEKTLFEGEKTSFQSILKDKDEQLRNLSKLETQLNFVTAEKEAHEQIITELRKQLNEKILELEEMHSHNYDGEIKNLNSYITEIQSFVKNVTEENDHLKKHIEEISLSLKHIEEENKLLIAEIEKSKKQFLDTANVKEATELQNSLKTLQDENEDLKKEAEKMSISLKNLEDKNQSLVNNLESLKQQISNAVSVQESTQAVNNQNSTLNDSKCRSRISDVVKPSRIPRLSNGLVNNKGKINQSSVQDPTELESSSIFANGSYFEHMTDISVAPSDIADSILLQNSSINQSSNNITGFDSKCEINESKSFLNFTYEDTIDNLTEKDVEELKVIILELYNIKNVLIKANEKLRNDLQCKTRETDEIKNDVGALKLGMQQLQETVYLLTNENADMGKKLAEAKACANERENSFEKLELDLMIQIQNLQDEKQTQEKDIMELKEKLEKIKDIKTNFDCEEMEKLYQLIKKHEERINDLTEENENLSSDLMEKIEELENIRLSKSLQYDHECKYREKVDYFIEKTTILERENAGLSNNLIERIEEIDILTKALKNNVSLEIQKEVQDQVEQSKLLDNSLREKIIDSNVSSIINKSVQNNSNMSLNVEKSINDIIIQYNENEILRQDIRRLENELKELKELNTKLSSMQLTSCQQCIHLRELNETRRVLKNEIKIVNKRLLSLQEKFNRECENEERLRNKATDMNVSLNNSSFNGSYFEGIEEIDAEEQVQRLQTDLENLQERYKSLSTSYKDKCDELNKYHDDNLLELSLTLTPERVNKTKQNTKLDKLQISLQKYKDEHQQLSKDLYRIDNALKKMQNQKTNLKDKVESLQTEKELLEKKLKNAEAQTDKTQDEMTTLLKQVQSLEEQLNQVNAENKDLLELKEVFEKQIENYKNQNQKNSEVINNLKQNLTEVEKSNLSLKTELEILKLNEKEKFIELQKYKQSVANLEAQVQELTNSLQHSEKMKNLLTEELAIIKSPPADSNEVALLTDKLEKYKLNVESLELSVKDLREKLSHYAKENVDLANEITKLQSQKQIDLNETYNRMEICDESFSKGPKELASEELDALRKIIMKELQALKTDLDCSKLNKQAVSEVFYIFVKTLLAKEQEMVKTLHRRFDREKNKIEEDKKQLIDAEKRVSTWAKELEAEIEKLQSDLSKEETKNATLKMQKQTLENSIMDYEHEKQLMKEKIIIMESDFSTLQNDVEKYTKLNNSHVISQEREKLIQDVTEKCKTEFQIKLNEAESEYKRRTEELTSALEQMKTKNKELMSNLEGLEINERQLKSILDMKTNELNKVNNTAQRLQKELENLSESYNQLNEDNQAKNCKIKEITGLLKVKCDKMSEYKTKLETITPEYDALKEQAEERLLRLEKYKSEVENMANENMKQMTVLKDELDIEKIKSTSLTKQINDITNRNTVIQVELEMLKEKCNELQQMNDKLVKKMRNSTSKISVERDMEDLKDENRTLSNKLEGASNRITELQKNKTELLKNFIDLQGQYNLSCQEINSLKIMLENYKAKFTSSDALDYRYKYDTLIQEKNKIALELENKRLAVIQFEEKVIQLTNENKSLQAQNKDLDDEMDDMLKKIREMEVENGNLLMKVFEMEDKEKIRNKIDDKSEVNHSNNSRNNSPTPSSRSKQRRSDLYNQNRSLINVAETENIRETCECENLRKNIITLEQDLALKNAKIESLKLQLECNYYPDQQKCVRLGEVLQENNSLKIMLENYKAKFTSSDALDYRYKYDTLIQEKNKIALELENKRLAVIQFEEKVIQLTNENKSLQAQNKDLDDEMDDMLKKIREMEVENGNLLMKVFEMEDKEKIRNKIDDKSETNHSNNSRNNSPIPSSRSKQRRSDLYNQNRSLINVAETENIRDTCECENLRKNIITLEQDLALKNAKIESLKLQLECNYYPHEQECVRLGEVLRSYKTKIQQLDNEITTLKAKPLDCERCKNSNSNQRHQSIQTDKEKIIIRMNGTHTSGLVEEHVKETEQKCIIKKLTKEKDLLKKLSLSRLEQIREFKKKVKDLEQDNTELKTQLSSIGHRRSSIQDYSMKENVPFNVLGQTKMIPHRYWLN